jgi:AcrR family transcriptional regulator
MGRNTGPRTLSAGQIESQFIAALEAIRGERGEPLEGKAKQIVEAALELLCQSGLESFSVRRVAGRADISLAALQYHFPTRADLISAMIEHRMGWYEDQLAGLLRSLASNPPAAFAKVIDWFLDDAASKGTTSFSLHFWALADYDESARAALDKYMRAYRELLAKLIGYLNPRISTTEALTRGAMLTSLIDGTMPITGYGKPHHPEFKNLRNSIRKIALEIAKAP